MNKGIVLVANLKSQWYCENLIYSIRKSGCMLPIRLIHFGGEKVNSEFILKEVEYLTIDNFSDEAKTFINNLSSVLTDCPIGFLYRFLAWFSDWDEFIYSDNDIVALMNWERLFEYNTDYEIVHADQEYTTQGQFNYFKPEKIEKEFGLGSLHTALTAGHMLVKKKSKMICDINLAIEWFKKHPDIPKKHDQSLLHVASLIGNWKLLNLCKPPYNWLSTWSEDYKNSLDLIHAMQGGYLQKTDSYKNWFDVLSDKDKIGLAQDSTIGKVNISHLHYAGRGRIVNEPIDDLMFSSHSKEERMLYFFKSKFKDLLLINFFNDSLNRIKRKIKKLII